VAVVGGVVSPTTPCLQSTPNLSKTVDHLGLNGSRHRPQTISVGLRCGREWWSGFRLGSKNTVKHRLTPGHPSSRNALAILAGMGASGG
jgi:hypothetical protein